MKSTTHAANLQEYAQRYLLNAYLNRELDPDAEAEFEELLIADPALAAYAEADLALSLGLAAAGIKAPDRTMNASKRPWLQQAIAASMLAVLAGGAGYSLRAPSIPFGGAQLVYVDKQRSGNETVRIPLPKFGPLLLMVPVASADQCAAEIEFSQGARRQTVSAMPDSYGYATVILPSEQLIPGPLQIAVSCRSERLGLYQAEVSQ
jgi:anti-sigma factor RsiW